MKLRPYQVQAPIEISSKFKENKRAVLLVLFMGLGKTVVACSMISEALKRKKRVLFLAHRTELIEQCHSKLKEFGVDAGIIMSGYKEERYKSCQVASIQTLIGRDWWDSDLIIVDEAHRSISATYLKTLLKYKELGAYIVGLTATPFRTKKIESFDVLYDDYVRTITVQEGIEKKYIMPSRAFACARIDTTKVKKKGSDFDDKELMKFFDTDKVYVNLITNYKKFIDKKKAIIFCVNVEHSKKTTECLIKAGYNGVHVDGNTPKSERKRITSDFKKGLYDFMSNVDIFTEGFDSPHVEAVVLNMATTSKSRYFQCAGRGSRPCDDIGKREYMVLDMADNVKRHGFVEDHYEVTLTPDKKNTSDKKGGSPCKDCPQCGYIVHARTPICPECSYVFPKTKRDIQEEEFIELDRKRTMASKYINYPRNRWHEIPTDLLEAFAKLKGYNKGWVNYELAKRKEGKKIIKISGYDGDDYFKQVNILSKAYYDKKYPIDANTFVFDKETETEIWFKYRLSKVPTI